MNLDPSAGPPVERRAADIADSKDGEPPLVIGANALAFQKNTRDDPTNACAPRPSLQFEGKLHYQLKASVNESQ